MIDMAVGDEQFLDSHAMLLRHRQQPVDIAARIGKGAAHSLGAPEQGAILLQRGDRDDDRLERWRCIGIHDKPCGGPGAAMQERLAPGRVR